MRLDQSLAGTVSSHRGVNRETFEGLLVVVIFFRLLKSVVADCFGFPYDGRSVLVQVLLVTFSPESLLVLGL